MQRRTFLQQSAILSAGMLVMPKMVFGNNQKIGLQLYTLRESVAKDVPGVFSQVAKAGYSELEMFGLSAENKFFGHTVKETAALLKQNNLTSPSGHYMPEKFLFNNGNGDDLKNLCGVANQLGQHLGQRGVAKHFGGSHASGAQRGGCVWRRVFYCFGKQASQHTRRVQTQRQRAGKGPKACRYE